MRHTWTVKSFCNTEPKICVALKRMLPLLDKNLRLKVRQFDRKGYSILIINTIQQYSKCFIIGRPLDNHKYNFSTSHSILQLL